MNDKISIIVPIYNTEKYLNKCIESIINQTYKNLQIILIDDGSIDNSAKICEEYSKKDDRILFIKKENTGVSDTRNLGIQKASGEYIGFIDSDDYIEKNMFEVLLTNLKKNDADMSICGYASVKNNEIKVLNNIQMFKFILDKNGPQGYLCNKLYKKSIIEKYNIKLDKKIYMCEDLLFNCLYLKNINKIVYTTEKLYNYIIRENGASFSPFSYKWATIIDAYEKLDEIYSIGDEESFDWFKVNYVMMNINTKTKMYLAESIDEKIKERCDKNINKYLKQVLKSKNIQMKSKIKVFIYYYFNPLINLMKKCLNKK